MQQEITNFVEKFRQKVENLWDEKTISPNYMPIDPEKPISAGNCAPTSIILFEELQREYPQEHFTLAIGQVLSGADISEPVIDYHVWVQWHPDQYKDTVIIDATSDQGGGISEKVIVHDMKDLARIKGLIYQAYNMYPDATTQKTGTKARADILRERLKEG